MAAPAVPTATRMLLAMRVPAAPGALLTSWSPGLLRHPSIARASPQASQHPARAGCAQLGPAGSAHGPVRRSRAGSPAAQGCTRGCCGRQRPPSPPCWAQPPSPVPVSTSPSAKPRLKRAKGTEFGSGHPRA